MSGPARVQLSAHPRATRHIATAKGWGGLIGFGAVLALWAVGLPAILGGTTLLKVLPLKWITRVAAVVILASDP